VILAFLLYNWYIRASTGYSSKYIKSVFGSKKSNNYEAEETVALLTLGLKHMLPNIPAVPRRLSNYQTIRLGGTLF
jgi:hypothetical protein